MNTQIGISFAFDIVLDYTGDELFWSEAHRFVTKRCKYTTALFSMTVNKIQMKESCTEVNEVLPPVEQLDV